MANTTLVMDVISKEVIRLFNVNSIVGNCLSRQYDKSYSGYGAAAGDTIRIKQPQRFRVSSGATIDIQDRNEKAVNLVRGTQKHIALAFTSKELTQDLLNPDNLNLFSKDHLETAVQDLSAEVDRDVLSQMMNDIYLYEGTYGVNPTGYASVTQCSKKLNMFGAPKMNRHLVLAPGAQAAMNEGMAGLFNPTAIVSDQFKNGMLANTNQFTFWESDFTSDHTNGAYGGTPVMSATVSEGASTLPISGFTAGSVITKGTILTVAGVKRRNYVSLQAKGALHPMVVLADATADGSGNVTLSIAPALLASATDAYSNVTALPQSGAAVTILGASSAASAQSLFFAKEGFVFATADLKDIGVHMERSITDPKQKISMHLALQGDIVNYKAVSRLDILYGYAAVCPWWGGRLQGSPE